MNRSAAARWRVPIEKFRWCPCVRWPPWARFKPRMVSPGCRIAPYASMFADEPECGCTLACSDRKIQVVPVREVAAVGQVQAEDGVARLQDRAIRFHVCR